MASMVSILLTLLITFNTATHVTPINPGKSTGNLNISEKTRLGSFQKILPVESEFAPQNLRLAFVLISRSENRVKYNRSVVGNKSLFHGRTYDPEVGLYYYRNRYYHPELGRFLQQDPMGYEDSMNMYQAFNMNPVNFTDPFGLDTDAGRIASSLNKTYGRKDLSWKSVDSFLTEISKNTQYMVQGGANLVLGGAQWALHQVNAFFSSLSGVDYYSYDLVNYQFDFDNPAGIFRTVDTRPSAEKALGMAGLDAVEGLYYWGKSGIMLLNPNLSEEESRAYKKTFFGGIPGVSLLAYGGYRFFSKGFVKNTSSISYLRKKYNITSREPAILIL